MNKKTILTILAIIITTITIQKGVAMPEETIEHIKGTSYSKVCKNGKCGIQDDYENRLVSDIKYDNIEKVGETAYFKVKIGDKYAMYSIMHQQEVSAFKFDNIAPISEDHSDYLKVSIDGKWAILDLRLNKYLSDYKYDKIDNMPWNSFFKVYIGDKLGLFYLERGSNFERSREVIPPTYDEILQLDSHKYFKISKNGLWGIYDILKKAVVIEPKYSNNDLQYDKWGYFFIKGQKVEL